jgi:predicted nucleic acid-binding protein
LIVADASAVAIGLGEDTALGRRLRRRFSGEVVVAPELLDIEVLAALRKLAAKGQLTEARARQAVAELALFDIERVSHRSLGARCWELRHNVTVYDAAYVALAEFLDAPLLTADRRLANAPGVRCTFELVS